MKKRTEEIVAFFLNFFPGLGFYFSGTMHDLKKLRLFGGSLAIACLFLLPIIGVILNPKPLINYHFTMSDMLLPLTIAIVSGFLGAIVEHRIREGC
jgi:hypothetical protein